MRLTYEEYIKNIDKPYTRPYYRELIKTLTTEEIIRRQIEARLDLYDYEDYLDDCEEREKTPFGRSWFKNNRKSRNDSSFWGLHHSIFEKDFTRGDTTYIKSLQIHEAERKGFINQNMCLFYKIYFKRKGRLRSL